MGSKGSGAKAQCLPGTQSSKHSRQVPVHTIVKPGPCAVPKRVTGKLDRQTSSPALEHLHDLI